MNEKPDPRPAICIPPSVRRWGIAAAIALDMFATPAIGQEMHDHRSAKEVHPPAAFVASNAKPFFALMDDAMAIMDDGMKRAPMNGVAEHDFVRMMIPHHQGAIDMAKAVLLYTEDPELKNLAQSIIVEQQNEIQVMQAWLRRHRLSQAGPATKSK